MSDAKITASDAGCWLEGSQGWTNNHRVVGRAVSYGFVVPKEYEEALEDYRQNGPSASENSWEAMVGQGGLSDQATDFLQALAPNDYEFVWDAGELSLMTSAEAEAFGHHG
ncbi:hypothetical protein ADL22_12610 [Streptomyces sp. NRRL F-4489]|uniref:hypothetical protein n=1 Tax=Streptomyces sp. NRRL F-4489 TaxID=1609095 RepID=UPI00074868B8|nr:hypothetical protein [Streptomyces sp. NRRL F-4489]KUL44778.1 hypothetical protein ADL22_12610 [Streptomyces sp. NRRL F-4489]